MKIEIEISEEHIKDILKVELIKLVQAEISQRSSRLDKKEELKSLIRVEWDRVARLLVKEEFENVDKLRTEIQDAMKKKISSQISAQFRLLEKE